MALKLNWRQRDAERIANGLQPDGLWIAFCPNGAAVLAGFRAEDRVDAEKWHFKTCPECLAAQQK